MKISAVGHFPQHGGQHAFRILDIHPPHAGWCRDADRAGDENDLGPRLARGLSDREAHFSGAAVADEPYRVDPLTRGTRRDQHPPALERPAARQQHVDAVGDLNRLQHSTLADFAAGLVALRGAEYLHTSLAEGGDVRRRGRVGPHDAVHGGHDGDRRLGRKA